MRPSSSSSSAKYRAHGTLDDPRDHLVSWSSSPTPASTPEYVLYDPRALGHVAYDQAYPTPSPAHVHTGHAIPTYPPMPQVYPVMPHQHHPQYSGYEPSMHPPPHQPSYVTASHVAPYSSTQPQQPQTHSHHPSHDSELSQYSLSRYKPPKHRFRIEQEGHNLVVLPPGEAPPSPPSPPSPESLASEESAPSPVPPPLPPLAALPAPPRQWPPSLYQTELSESEAKEYITSGAPIFRGELRDITNAPKGHYHFFGFAGDEWDESTDTAAFQSDVFGDMSSAPEGKQTDALERPAMGHAFGIYPGTITLACYVSGFGSNFRGSELAARAKVRKLSMLYVLDRLRTLQVQGIEEDPVDLHHHLYEYLLYDNHKYDYPHGKSSYDAQIADLVAALCRPSWVDFSLPENQTIARFLSDPNPAVHNGFFHQLLLSIELYLRINARHRANVAMKRLGDIPDKIRWDLMMAQRWLENVEMEAPKKVKDINGKRGAAVKSTIGFKFPNKKNQVEALRNFAWTLKWPNMHEVEYALSESEQEAPSEYLEDKSVNCMSWFTGLLLPGKSMPWILMNALTDLDPDVPEEFRDLDQTVLNLGFQYRGHTYWSWECIVGKVLGAALGVSHIAGWIGPCSASADLERSEVALINQAPPKGNCIAARDVRNMAENSDPLGAFQTKFPVTDYNLVVPDPDDAVDSIRIERLNFSASASNPMGIHTQGLLESGGDRSGKRPFITFDASITFAITVEKRARSWKVSLRHDTPFIAAYPCTNGPHALFCEYQYRSVKADKLVEIQNWGISGGGTGSELDDDYDDDEEDDVESTHEVEEVLVVEAFGVPDNEVFARAWCSFWGLPAVTADVGKTCMSCAIREAYAAMVSVVILTNRSGVDVEVEEVDRLMENL
ncbi:hypothetical protein RUND412_008451 [Rhizina undulata]